MLRRPALLILPLALGLGWAAHAALTTVTVTIGTPPPTVVYLTSGTTWTVPANWNSASNTIEAIGGGGGGVNGAAGFSTGGGGGAYSKVSNLVLTSGSTITYGIGAGGSGTGAPGGNGGDTYFNGTSCSASSLCAKGGEGGQNSASGGGQGGQASAGIGAVKYSGGNGGSNTSDVGAGGGAGGPNGNGANAGNAAGSTFYDGGAGGGAAGGGSAGGSPTGNNGAAGGNNYLRTGGGAGGTSASVNGGAGNDGAGGGGGYGGGATAPGGAGGNGTEWDSAHGAGGGGGGGGAVRGTTTGGAGGLYGGGGGASAYSGSGGNGAPGIIVITYTPGSGGGDPAPTATLAASPTSITSGGSSTLTWSSTGATSCSGTGFTASGTSGSVSVSPAQTTTYSITCAGSGSTSSPTSATVTVAAQNSNLRVAFTPLHVYYMSPTGSDSNSGTSPSQAWATPNHSGLVCGDVIIAAPGEYTQWDAYPGIIISSQPSNCPSRSGGIDGTGGVYFVTVLCAGNVGSCYLVSQGGYQTMVTVEANNWAFEGWLLTSNLSAASPGSEAFEVRTCASATTQFHHFAVVNTIGYAISQLFEPNDCGMNHNVPGNGADYFAAVGDIAQNANSDPSCVAAIDAVAPGNTDTDPGTHILFDGNFLIDNAQQQKGGCTGSDGEGIMFDSLDVHGFVGTAIAENNIIYYSAAFGLQIFQQGNNSSAPYLNVFNNTLYDDGQCASYAGGGTTGDLNLNLTSGFPWTMGLYSNIIQDTSSGMGCASTNRLYALHVTGTSNGGIGAGSNVVNIGGTGAQNVLKANQTVCNATCDPGDNMTVEFGFTNIGTNTYTDPGFANTSDLIANHLGPPDCSAYTNTTACMGWNYATEAAATDSVIGDVTPSASGTSGKGYQPPGACGDETTLAAASISGTTLTFAGASGIPVGVGEQVGGAGVAANTIITGGSGTSWTVNNSQTVSSETMGATYYPYWLKGINYLQWDGANLWEYNGLTNKPCGA